MEGITAGLHHVFDQVGQAARDYIHLAVLSLEGLFVHEIACIFAHIRDFRSKYLTE